MVGIVGYGAYVPKYRIKSEEIAKIWNEDGNRISKGLLINEKSVPDIDEDTVTISVEAAKNAIAVAGIEAEKIGSVYIGSESHPYAVKSSAAIVAEVLGIVPYAMCADLEFACKAGTAGMQMCMGLVKSGMVDYGLAIGADTAQGRPNDALEYSAAAGGGGIYNRRRGKLGRYQPYGHLHERHAGLLEARGRGIPEARRKVHR